MFEAVGVLAVSACILQMVYEKFDEQRTTVDYTEENKQFQHFCLPLQKVTPWLFLPMWPLGNWHNQQIFQTVIHWQFR